VALEAIAKSAVEGMANTIENGPGKFEVSETRDPMRQSIEDGPGKFETSEDETLWNVEGTDLNGPDLFDAEDIRDTFKAEGPEPEKEGIDEIRQKQGGSYSELKHVSKEGQEIHHMPADSISPLERNDGPAIIMDKDDHRKTASCGNSKEAQEYRARQAELIEQGKFEEAVRMDIDDLYDKFGDKYDQGIGEMKEYAKQLHEEGKI
jgi:hypothetical protein